MAKITRFFDDINLTAGGLEIPNIIGSITNLHTGVVDQIIISRSIGAATTIDVQLRYEQGNSSRERLAYLFTSGTLPLFVDSRIDGPFSLSDKVLQGDLHLYLQPDADCTVNIRVDMDINNISGL